MSSIRTLRRRLRTMDTLAEAVGALRALSAQHFRQARTLLPAARTYRADIQACLDAILPEAPPPATGPCGIIVITTDLGLVGDYTRRVVEAALELRSEQGPGPVVCLGDRSVAALARAQIRPDVVRSAPTSVRSLPELLLPLVDALLALRRRGRLGSLWLVGAVFEGAGHYHPACVPLLPVRATGQSSVPLSSYCRPMHARTVIVREHLYATLHEALLEALASEHGKRLVMADAARRWVDERSERIRRRICAISREVSTQEVLEIAAAAHSVRRTAAERET